MLMSSNAELFFLLAAATLFSHLCLTRCNTRTFYMDKHDCAVYHKESIPMFHDDIVLIRSHRDGESVEQNATYCVFRYVVNTKPTHVLRKRHISLFPHFHGRSYNRRRGYYNRRNQGSYKKIPDGKIRVLVQKFTCTRTGFTLSFLDVSLTSTPKENERQRLTKGSIAPPEYTTRTNRLAIVMTRTDTSTDGSYEFEITLIPVVNGGHQFLTSYPNTVTATLLMFLCCQ